MIENIGGGTISIEGSPGEINGVPVAAIQLTAGQWKRFDDIQYQLLTITCPVGVQYRLNVVE